MERMGPNDKRMPVSLGEPPVPSGLQRSRKLRGEVSETARSVRLSAKADAEAV